MNLGVLLKIISLFDWFKNRIARKEGEEEEMEFKCF